MAMAKSDLPPVPPEGKSRKGPGDAGHVRDRSDGTDIDERDRNLDQQGRQGNIRENTRNQGYQQDR
jgi:hypothetical protein